MLILVIGVLLFPASPSLAAIRPDQLILLVNKDSPEGLRIARYYMEKRNVPRQNMVVIKTSREESMGRKEYDKEIAAPVRSFLMKNDPAGNRFSCLVLLYGIPLRIDPPRLDPPDESRLKELREKLSTLKEKAKAVTDTSSQEAKGLKDDISRTETEIVQTSKSRQVASVDSEIALVMENNYSLDGWLPNRFFVGFRGKNVPDMPLKVIPVCRLDGPTEAIVYRIINDSLFAEENKLSGKAYFDMRWSDKGAQGLSPYQIYDRSIRNTSRIVKESGRMPVITDEREALFGPGEARDAALYCGWYSLAKYVDAFTWARGAVGYHVASAECTTLKAATSTVWCKTMLEKGVAATLGPVAEPYLQSFPAPEVFFGCLLNGGSLIECYTVSNPFWSWQMVLIGDPLYCPFKERR